MIPIESHDWFEAEQLHFAAMSGDLPRCEELIANGYDPNAFDEIGHTALHYAAEIEHFDIVTLLLSHGADVNAIDVKKIGRTPLSHVAQTCSLKMAQLLLDAGADPTLRIGLNRHALDLAKERKRGEGPRVYELLCCYAGR
jgi:ankyrin repeat protein